MGFFTESATIFPDLDRLSLWKVRSTRWIETAASARNGPGGGPRINHAKDHCRDDGKNKFLVKVHEHFECPRGEEGGGAEPAKP